MEEDDGRHGAFGLGFRCMNIDVERQISELLVGYDGGCRFRHH